MTFHIKTNDQKVRFALVGVLNTVISYTTFILLSVMFQVPVASANIMSTGLALLVSFFLNGHFVFQSKHQTVRMFVLFLLVTIINLWIIQTSVILLVLHLIRDISLHQIVALTIAKGAGIAVSMVCNYVAYQRIYR